MSESQIGRADLYDDFVPAFLDFIHHQRHSGSRSPEDSRNLRPGRLGNETKRSEIREITH